MQPYDDNIVTFQILFEGFTGARDRFHAAKTNRDPGPAFVALFEALNWAVALDDRRRMHWAPDGKALDWKWRDRVPDAPVLAGVPFFYWYQMLWIPLSVICTLVVYNKTRRGPAR